MLNISKIDWPGIVIYIYLKENGLSPILCSLHLIGEGRLAVVNLDNLVIPVVQEGVLNLTGGETYGKVILTSSEDVLHSQSDARNRGEHDGLCLRVGNHLRVDLFGGLLILRADVLNRGGQVGGGVILHEIGVQSRDGVLLHNNCLSGLGSFLLLLYIYYTMNLV